MHSGLRSMLLLLSVVMNYIQGFSRCLTLSHVVWFLVVSSRFRFPEWLLIERISLPGFFALYPGQVASTVVYTYESSYILYNIGISVVGS